MPCFFDCFYVKQIFQCISYVLRPRALFLRELSNKQRRSNLLVLLFLEGICLTFVTYDV